MKQFHHHRECSVAVLQPHFPPALGGIFLLLTNISWYGSTIVCLIIHPLKDICVVSNFLAIVDKAAINFYVQIFVCPKFSFIWDKCPEMQLSGCMIVAHLVLRETVKLFSEWLYHFAFRPAMYK